jgi:dethiobiotin synthetase
VIRKAYLEIAEKTDIVIVEGAGGWLVPINEKETMANVAEALSLDVITVVGIRLGCLNHALLTTQSIADSGLNQRGWIANHLSPDVKNAKENVNALRQRIISPCLGEIKFNATFDASMIACQLNITDIGLPE